MPALERMKIGDTTYTSTGPTRAKFGAVVSRMNSVLETGHLKAAEIPRIIGLVGAIPYYDNRPYEWTPPMTGQDEGSWGRNPHNPDDGDRAVFGIRDNGLWLIQVCENQRLRDEGALIPPSIGKADMVSYHDARPR